MSFLSLFVIILVIGLASQGYVNSQLHKYEEVPSASGLTGAQIAVQMLANSNITNVSVKEGDHDDGHFDPRDNSITLPPKFYNSSSITAVAVGCHEAGHAIQYAYGYKMMKFRSFLAPACSVASNLWGILLLVGILLNMLGLMYAGIILFAVVLFFQLVTLPVEFDASRRAIAYLSSSGIPMGEVACEKSVLRACALTYVAAALSSALQLLWFLSSTRN